MSQEEPRRALVVVAHPDDAEFIAGGAIAKLCAEGWEVYYVVATSGDKGTHDLEISPQQLARLREDEQRAAARVLGVGECVFLGYPDGFLEDTAELRGQMVRLIRHYKPATVITWDPYRRPFNHRDHRLAGQVAVDAAYPLARGHLFYPKHLQEGLEPHRTQELLLAGTDQPDHYIDISQYLDKKVEALRCHASQMRGRSREEMAKMVRERGEEVGKAGGVAVAEAFRRLSFRR
ncbi:MAG: PIG-L deacetylase family protein [Dehalococcoidia bacterium]